ncbi:MAG: pyridoxal phosphate-dependent aminotransferase [Defluviitaleaceae bacterium]|nr:pyridoxal phosphate-dependent aminotransferase [Defluviitaleaceae bacterium]
MKYNFDEVINRHNTNSYKYDFPEMFNKPKDALPLWVADMDFRIPPEVMAAIQKVADHGIYGYAESKDDYFNAVASWFASIHDYHVKSDWMVKVPGVVFALGMAIKGLTAPGDAIVIQKPLYYPIENTIVANGRITVDNPLVYSQGRYTLDLEDFERKIVDNNAKMFILCNPHNPVGRVWTRDELLCMGRICQKHNCIVVSDEIHCDLVFDGHKHLVFSTICDTFADFSVICTAPSKTFNLAGLQNANIFISNKGLRARFKHEIWASGYAQLNVMGMEACKAAYIHGRQWLTELMQYLANNAAYVCDTVAVNLPKIKPIALEGTYLQWLDFNALGLSHDELEDRLNRANVWLSSGTAFGAAGAGFFRVNLACPRSTLEVAMQRVVSACSESRQV